MAVPAGTPSAPFLPATQGHAVRATEPTRAPHDAIEQFAALVLDALRETRATGREHGFLAYAPSEPGAPLVAEPMSVGEPDAIAWHWHAPDATVAFSFHTHPGDDALCVPSGIDIVGALIRGDHVMYVMTDTGRITGWRLREPTGHPRALLDTLLTLVDAGRLDARFIAFLYDATDALRDELLERVYSARARDGRLVPTRARVGRG